MLIAYQLGRFYPDLPTSAWRRALALVHSRFSTNTFPSWELAHPYRMIAHNGEINTLRGNVNWMRARESQLATELFGDDLAKVLPVVRPGGSDSATFDNVLELLDARRPLAAARADDDDPRGLPGPRRRLPPELGGFYAFHACLMEPWDGPAAIAFTDGRVIGATLDRNGLRPGRWLETNDGWVVLGSEAGAAADPGLADHAAHGRLQPGKLFLVDLAQGRIVPDAEVKRAVADAAALRRLVRRARRALRPAPARAGRAPLERAAARAASSPSATRREDISVMLPTMVRSAEEPIGSMGADISLAALSRRAPPLFNYFKQLFAQVTNPPIDPIREEIVMSIGAGLGAEGNLLEREPEHAHQLVLDQPILRNHELETLRTRLARRLQAAHDRHHLAGRRGRRGHGGGARRASATRPTTRSRAASTSSSSPTARSAPSARRSRRCSPSPPSTTTSCARARACRRGS